MTLLTDTGQQQLEVDFCGLPFATPLVLLSGCVGFGEEYTRVSGFSNRDAGAVCLKGTTLEPRLGNPPHRLAETPMGMLNAIGLQNPGVDHVVSTILPSLDFTETTPNEYLMQHAPLSEVEHTLEAVLPDARMQKLLEIGPDEPCLQLHRRTWSRGLVASRAWLTHPGSRYRISARFNYTDRQ